MSYKELVHLVYTSQEQKVQLEENYKNVISTALPAIRLSSQNDPDLVPYFDVTQYFNNLKTQICGRTFLFSRLLPSTQTFITQYFQNSADGISMLVDCQTQGKGRGTNVWDSPEGCLLVSFTCSHTKGATLPHIQYIVSLALIRALKTLLNGQDIGIRLKWPNDIYNGPNQKIGGILCHSTYNGQIFKIVIGMGLNLSNKEPTTCINQMIKERLRDHVTLSRESLLAQFYNHFEPMLKSLNEYGFDGFLDEYLKYWLHSDQHITFTEGSLTRNLIVKGITQNGYLLAQERDSKQCYELHPDSTSFNFWEGFVTRKLN